MQNTFKLSSFVMVSMNGQYIRVYLYSESQICIYDYIHFEEPQKTKANTGGKNDRRTDWGNLHINIPPPYIPYVYTSSSDCYLPTTTNVPVVRWKKKPRRQTEKYKETSSKFKCYSSYLWDLKPVSGSRRCCQLTKQKQKT